VAEGQRGLKGEQRRVGQGSGGSVGQMVLVVWGEDLLVWRRMVGRPGSATALPELEEVLGRRWVEVVVVVGCRPCSPCGFLGGTSAPRWS